jgi:hypothetical protein
VNHLSLFGDFPPRFDFDRGLFLDPGDQSRPEWPRQGKERSVPPDPLQRCRKLLRHVRDRPTSDSWPVVADVTAPQALPRDQGAVLTWLKSSSSRAVTCRTRAEHLPFRSPTVRRVVGPCVKLWRPLRDSAVLPRIFTWGLRVQSKDPEKASSTLRRPQL